MNDKAIIPFELAWREELTSVAQADAVARAVFEVLGLAVAVV